MKKKASAKKHNLHIHNLTKALIDNIRPTLNKLCIEERKSRIDGIRTFAHLSVTVADDPERWFGEYVYVGDNCLVNAQGVWGMFEKDSEDEEWFFNVWDLFDLFINRSNKASAIKQKQNIMKQTNNNSTLLTTYYSMLSRCYNPNTQNFPYYGGRGITVCKSWIKNKEHFLRWATSRYMPGLEIDRIDNNKGYSPRNCRFVTHAENLANRNPFHRKDKLPKCIYKYSAQSGLYLVKITRFGQQNTYGVFCNLDHAIQRRDEVLQSFPYWPLKRFGQEKARRLNGAGLLFGWMIMPCDRVPGLCWPVCFP